jgi:hypothetical protein
MRVTIISEVEYEPTASDHRSCWGSLHKRPRVMPDGICGPMVYYFPKGRTPDLRDEAAADFITRGVAVAYDNEQVVEQTTTEILAGMAVTQ